MSKFQVGDIVKYVGHFPHKQDKYAIVVGYPKKSHTMCDYCYVEYFDLAVTYQAEQESRLEKINV